MKGISTKSQMPSPLNNHAFIFGKVGSAREKKAKILIGFKKKVNTLAIEESGMNTSSRTTITVTTRLNERILIEHIATRLTSEATKEKRFWAALSTRKMTHSLHTLSCTTSLLSQQPGWIHLLHLPTGRTTILTHPSERRKVRAKAKARANSLFVNHVRHWRIADNG